MQVRSAPLSQDLDGGMNVAELDESRPRQEAAQIGEGALALLEGARRVLKGAPQVVEEIRDDRGSEAEQVEEDELDVGRGVRGQHDGHHHLLQVEVEGSEGGHVDAVSLARAPVRLARGGRALRGHSRPRATLTHLESAPCLRQEPIQVLWAPRLAVRHQVHVAEQDCHQSVQGVAHGVRGPLRGRRGFALFLHFLKRGKSSVNAFSITKPLRLSSIYPYHRENAFAFVIAVLFLLLFKLSPRRMKVQTDAAANKMFWHWGCTVGGSLSIQLRNPTHATIFEAEWKNKKTFYVILKSLNLK